jgi:hypothetical protein
MKKSCNGNGVYCSIPNTAHVYANFVLFMAGVLLHTTVLRHHGVLPLGLYLLVMLGAFSLVRSYRAACDAWTGMLLAAVFVSVALVLIYTAFPYACSKDGGEGN